MATKLASPDNNNIKSTLIASMSSFHVKTSTSRNTLTWKRLVKTCVNKEVVCNRDFDEVIDAVHQLKTTHTNGKVPDLLTMSHNKRHIALVCDKPASWKPQHWILWIHHSNLVDAKLPAFHHEVHHTLPELQVLQPSRSDSRPHTPAAASVVLLGLKKHEKMHIVRSYPRGHGDQATHHRHLMLYWPLSEEFCQYFGWLSVDRMPPPIFREGTPSPPQCASVCRNPEDLLRILKYFN